MTPRPPIVDRNAYGEAFFVRPQRPDDHTEFEWLLPQMTPLFIYLDDNLRGWVRWSMPPALVAELGWTKCSDPECDETHEPGVDEAFHVDTALDETDWFFDAPPQNPLFRN